MISPISLFLPEFSPSTLTLDPGFEAAPEPEGFAMTFDEPDEIEPDLEPDPRLVEARAEGFAEGSAMLETALASQAAELENQHAQALETARAQWAIEAAGEFATAVQAALDDLERRLAEGVAEVLEPALGLALRQRAAEELREAVSSLVATGQGTAIRLSGPADLVEPLRAAFEGRASIEAVVTEAPEIEVESDGTLIRSQLGPWVEALRSSLEGSL